MKNGASAKPPKSFAYELKIVPRPGFTDVVTAALAGDIEAQRISSVVIGWLGRYRSNRDQVDCFSCGSPLLSPPTAMLVLLPLRMTGRQAIAGGLCPSCHALPGGALMDAVMGTITRAMPSARLRVTPGAGGRA